MKTTTYYQQMCDGIRILKDKLPTASISHNNSMKKSDINAVNEQLQQFEDIIQQIKKASELGHFSIRFKNDCELDHLIIKTLRNKGYTYSLTKVGGKDHFHVINWDKKIK